MTRRFSRPRPLLPDPDVGHSVTERPVVVGHPLRSEATSIISERYAPPERGIGPIESERDDLSLALDGVVGRFGALMRRIGRGHRLPEEDIDEAIQEVRIRLWRSLATAGSIRRVPATYIYRTTVSAMLDLIRRRQSRRESAIESLDAREGGASLRLTSATERPDARLDTDDVEQAVSEAIDEITATRRPVVRMYLAGYGREEIARLLHWSEAKTRNLLYRGLAELRERLAARGVAVPEER